MGVIPWLLVADSAWRGGFRGFDLTTAIAITQPESGRNTDSRYVTSQEDSRGLWQINTYAHPQYDRNRLYDRLYNAVAAFQVYRNSNSSFHPWTTYVAGKHRPFLNDAADAVRQLQSLGFQVGDGSGPPPGAGEGGSEIPPVEIDVSWSYIPQLTYAGDMIRDAAFNMRDWGTVIGGLIQ